MGPPSTFVGLPVIPPNDPSLNAPSPTPRAIRQILEARSQPEGAGATVRRSIGTPSLRHITPFLLLDHASISPGAGFPDHPHRGQETITYILSGAVDHEDFAGNRGTIYEGDLQFMTAGLWVDLPRELKDVEPRYRDLRASEIPRVEADEGRVGVKVISGRSYAVDGVRELAYTPVWLLDVTIQAGGRFRQALPAGWNAFAYTLEGTTTFDTGATMEKVARYHNAVFEQKGDQVLAQVPADAKEAARFLLVAGMPLDQPVVQYGPFVLNDASGVRQAIMDYQSFQNGFERAEGWQSEIGRVMV
ncbi:RNA pol II transcription cofactor [Friedmanniomyces endolithicus]|nr:RNA pol II transcription cofactor [Friedmanniomyces endolithicus]KAK0790724.1 RNA pol II transcription cofactor [Friedmanniomyces endolithicus]KAK0799237.1 RNA pol II transcription cofactor [Friedmanniomyces endolithicus]